MQNFRALGAESPDPRASGGWGLRPPDPHWPPAAGGSAPRQPPPLRISGYAPDSVTIKFWNILQRFYLLNNL